MTRIGIVTVALAGAVGCSFIKGLMPGGGKKPSLDDVKAKAPGGGGATPAAAEAQAVPAAPDDPEEVRSAISALEEGEQALAKGNLDAYARVSTRLNFEIYAKKSLDGAAKGPKLKARLATLDRRAVDLVGGNLKRVYGDGVRVTTNKGPDAVEAMDKAISLCRQATETSGGYSAGETHATRLADNLKKYEEALARAQRADATIVRYVGDWTAGGYTDVPMELLKCEATIAAHRLDVEDEYAPEVASGENEKGCGKIEFLADGVQIGSARFAPYARTAGGQSYPEKLDCKKIPKKGKAGKELAHAIREFIEREGLTDAVVVSVGRPEVREDSDDLRLHRYQQLVAYSHQVPFAKNPCGKGEKLFCEAGGSNGMKMFNQMSHHLARADVHAGPRADRCKQHLKAAAKLWEQFRDFRDEKKKSGEWIEGATYKTRKGEKLPEAAFVARFAADGKLADDRSLGDYCAKPVAVAATAPKKPGKPAK